MSEARLSLAIELMEEALRVLGAEPSEAVAAPLRKAISEGRCLIPPRPENPEVDDDHLPPQPLDAPLVRAMGGALGIVATILQRGGLTSAEEFGKILGIYGVVSAETCAEEGLILGCWAGMVDQLAPKSGERAAH